MDNSPNCNFEQERLERKGRLEHLKSNAGVKESPYCHYKELLSDNFSITLILSLFFMISGFLIAYSYFRGLIPYDRFSWIFWLASIIFLVISVSPKRHSLSDVSYRILFFVLGVTALYFITHLINYNTAPWNSFGLFDDAAWDIYFVQDFTMPGASIQVAFNDMQVGRIGRELIFHYYIGIWFMLFGFNLFVFNMALVFLGYITVLFTALLAYNIFDSFPIGIAAAVLMNFYPMHFTQVFMGHRYAICAPLMMISLFYLYTGFKTDSRTRGILGGVFAALCMSSAIMGKQFIYGLIGSVFLFIVFHIRKRKELADRTDVASYAFVGFVFGLVPLLSYMSVNNEIYTMRESSLIKEFFDKIRENGLEPLWENIRVWYKTVFDEKSFQRQFMHNYPILHWSMLGFVVFGTFLSFIRKHYYIALMIAIPTAGCFVTICYDFRLLISAPFIILAVVFSLSILTGFIKDKRIQTITVIAISLVLSISPMIFLYRLSLNPNGQYLLPHRSVAASRFIQDVVVGVDNPDFSMKKDEFRRAVVDFDYDTLASARESYAHVHAFLHDYDAYKVLNLLSNFPYRGRDPSVLKGFFTEAIAKYERGSKDLMIVIEEGSEVSSILEILSSFNNGRIKEYGTVIDGLSLNIFTMRIPNENIEEFKEFVDTQFRQE